MGRHKDGLPGHTTQQMAPKSQGERAATAASLLAATAKTMGLQASSSGRQKLTATMGSRSDKEDDSADAGNEDSSNDDMIPANGEASTSAGGSAVVHHQSLVLEHSATDGNLKFTALRRIKPPAQKSRKKPTKKATIHPESNAAKARREKQSDLTKMGNCDDVQEFAHAFIWKRPAHPHDGSGPPVGSNEAAFNAFVSRQLADATAAIDFWWQAWPAALHIAAAWQGANHYRVVRDDFPPNQGRMRWHIIFVAAAIHMDIAGSKRSHAFVGDLWKLTMANFMVDKTFWDPQTGARSPKSKLRDDLRTKEHWVRWADNNQSLVLINPEPRMRIAHEKIFDLKSKSTANSAMATFKEDPEG